MHDSFCVNSLNIELTKLDIKNNKAIKNDILKNLSAIVCILSGIIAIFNAI